MLGNCCEARLRATEFLTRSCSPPVHSTKTHILSLKPQPLNKIIQKPTQKSAGEVLTDSGCKLESCFCSLCVVCALCGTGERGISLETLWPEKLLG